MSLHTIGSLSHLTATQLYSLLTQTTTSSTNLNPSVAVIDVRDDDYVGGHIRSCIHVPTPSLDYRLPELVRTLQDKEAVVFHCMLSQQRGPSAALRYLRERDRLLGASGNQSEQEQGQTVYVLQGGFQAWMQKYGKNEGVTEGFDEELWEGEVD